MAVRRVPDGRRFHGKAEADEMPDPELPCPECGQEWEEHGDVVIFRLTTGEVGWLLPRCPGS